MSNYPDGMDPMEIDIAHGVATRCYACLGVYDVEKHGSCPRCASAIERADRLRDEAKDEPQHIGGHNG